jgi:hypothetical protein
VTVRLREEEVAADERRGQWPRVRGRVVNNEGTVTRSASGQMKDVGACN